VKSLGRPASHGCIRLQTGNAAQFYSLVQQVGRGNTRITVVN
jgi:lipoprotein-anchoring transpeptidase ErfK/SrfK